MSWSKNISWLALWRHRWEVLNLLNQIARGNEYDAIRIANWYGGCDEVGVIWYEISRDIIRP